MLDHNVIHSNPCNMLQHGDENEHQVGLMKMEWNGRFQPVAVMK